MKSRVFPLSAVVVFLFWMDTAASKPRNLGYFWQVSDFHYDANYSTTGVPQQMCHRGNTNAPTIGSYGNYLCDAPWKLITAAVQGMKTIHDDPDFILWTGDSVPHVNDTDLSSGKVYQLIGNVTDELLSVFPNTTIYPVLGNHDPYPSNEMPFDVDKTEYFRRILNNSGWDEVLGKPQAEQFKRGGYYSVKLSDKIKLLGLNTNLYNGLDKLTKDIPDPAGQFQFMERELKESKDKNHAVLIVAHIPPGVFELVPDLMWFSRDFNKRYLDIVTKYSDIISAHMYGHEHTDSFRLLYNKDGKPISSMFLCPAVTPWKSTLPGVGANNPSIRLYQYDQDNGVILKYEQYFLNLTAANLENDVTWRLEYDTQKDFGLDNLKPDQVGKFVNMLQNRQKEFKLYLEYNSVQYNMEPECNDTCFQQHICAIRELSHDRYTQCLTGDHTTKPPSHSTTHKHHHPHPPPPQDFPEFMYYIIGVLGVVVFVVFLIVAFLCFNRRRRVAPPRYSKFGSIQSST